MRGPDCSHSRKGRRINKPSDVLSVGDEVTVWVTGVEAKRQRIGLTMIEPPALPWPEVKKGHTYRGKVTRLERFGAFVDIGAERDGLVHVSELAAGYVRDPSEVVSVGEEVEVTVVDVNARKVSFSWMDGSKEGAREYRYEVNPFDEALVKAGGWVEFADTRY